MDDYGNKTKFQYSLDKKTILDTYVSNKKIKTKLLNNNSKKHF